MVRSVRRHALATYFTVTFAVSWGYWIPIAVTGGHVTHYPGLIGPMVAALVVTPIVAGKAGVRDLVAHMRKWRVPWRWYAMTALPMLTALGALCVAALFGAGFPSLDDLSHMPGVADAGWLGVSLVTLIVNGYGEETGWRGFAWPRLRERHSLARSALILAVPWAVWHIPTFFIDSGMRDFPPVMIPGFFVGMAAGAVVLGWMYERCGSLLVVALWHTMLNMASASTGTTDVAAAVSMLVIVWAIALLRREHAATATAPSAAPPRLPGWPATGTS